MSVTVTLCPDTKERIVLGKLARGVSSFHATTEKRGRIILEPYTEIGSFQRNQPQMDADSRGWKS